MIHVEIPLTLHQNTKFQISILKPFPADKKKNMTEKLKFISEG